MKIVAAAALSALVLASLGCSTTSHLSVITGKNVDVSKFPLSKEASRGRGAGKDCQTIIVVFPTSGPPSADEAVDRAVENRRGDVLVNATVGYYTYYIPYLYGQTCWTAEGEVYDSRH